MGNNKDITAKSNLSSSKTTVDGFGLESLKLLFKLLREHNGPIFKSVSKVILPCF